MVKVIAEIGINHAGDIKLVKELIKTAKVKKTTVKVKKSSKGKK